MSSNQPFSVYVLPPPSHRSRLSRTCRHWAKCALLSASLGAAILLGIGAAPTLAAPTNSSDGPSVFNVPVSSDSGTGGPTVFDVITTPDNGSGGPTVF